MNKSLCLQYFVSNKKLPIVPVKNEQEQDNFFEALEQEEFDILQDQQKDFLAEGAIVIDLDTPEDNNDKHPRKSDDNAIKLLESALIYTSNA